MNAPARHLDHQAQGSVLQSERPVDVGELPRRAEWIRLEAIRLIDGAGLGHYSSTFSCAELYACRPVLPDDAAVSSGPAVGGSRPVVCSFYRDHR